MLIGRPEFAGRIRGRDRALRAGGHTVYSIHEMLLGHIHRVEQVIGGAVPPSTRSLVPVKSLCIWLRHR